MPTSVGALMAPEYLRRAIGDFGDRDVIEQHPDVGAGTRFRQAFAVASRAAMRALGRHIGR
jgi:hypothetical protein